MTFILECVIIIHHNKKRDLEIKLGDKMKLIERAEKEAKKNGIKMSKEAKRGLMAAQKMHDIAGKVKGSAYKVYETQKWK